MFGDHLFPFCCRNVLKLVGLVGMAAKSVAKLQAAASTTNLYITIIKDIKKERNTDEVTM